ncbi:MAG: M23 family metallopeptidase [Oscillospiraceae bacterium]|nr:M23 family metallopeptidase [Oscillospiraceae bacterium]
MSKKKFSGNISGKGYYIALILCAVAIGITGYLYYRNANDTEQLNSPVEDTTPQLRDDDMEVVATPGDDDQVSVEEPDNVTVQKPAKIVRPVSGDTAAPYSMEMLSYNQTTRDWRVHDGMDIAAEAGTEVCAAAEGTVYTVCEDETMGMTVVISHSGGYITEYASLDENVQVKPGDTVTAGQCIGYVGSSALLESAIGDHVHFEVTCNGKTVDPMDFLGLE